MQQHPSIIVIGGLNTDIIAAGVDRLLGSGELTLSGELKIAPGGKSRNMAQMMSMLAGEGAVAMIGRTCKDTNGLWEVPYQALIEHGVNVRAIKIMEEEGKSPGVALIPVDRNGRNQIYVLPGVNDEFCPQDIDDATDLFEQAGEQNGVLALSLELPMATAKHAVKKAKKYGMTVVLDPGGIRIPETEEEYQEYLDLLSMGVDLVKPNEHEMKILTRVEVVDFDSANLATHLFRKIGVSHTVVTVGSKGAYLFTPDVRTHIPIPQLDIQGEIQDETGCGDQTMAVICTALQRGDDIQRAVELGVLAGTLQFYRSGVEPLNMEELEAYIK